MTHETRHTFALIARAATFRDPLAGAAAAYAKAHNALIGADDIVAAFRACGGLILAAEALGNLAADAHRALRDVLAQEMAEVGASAISTDTHVISYAQAPTRVNITDETAIPAQFKSERVTIVTDVHAIAKAVKSGDDVPGVQIIDNRAPVLRITKRKA